jgi:hypothetical protein
VEPAGSFVTTIVPVVAVPVIVALVITADDPTFTQNGSMVVPEQDE